MKKYGILGLVIMLFTCFVFYFYSQQRNWNELSVSTSTLVYEMNEKDLENIGIERTWLGNYYVLSSLSCLENERIFVLEVKEDWMQKTESVLKNYIIKLEGKKRKGHSLWFKNDKFLVVALSPNAHTIMKEVKRFLGYEENEEIN